ncbi:hypothetical protein FKW77_010069 [Venturia effusa]|uniref:Uncharacterized protein n=1 Tax=Venturia effusa TaxID=50376 RepID=A0A517L4B9_9PEZI|nr:hypothetical protein FKW77_010069 [Venturia effusa]
MARKTSSWSTDDSAPAILKPRGRKRNERRASSQPDQWMGDTSSTAVGDEVVEATRFVNKRTRKKLRFSQNSTKVKTWNPIFATSRQPRKSEIWVDTKRSMNADGEESTLFLQDTAGSLIRRRFDEVRQFCEGAELVTLRAGRGDAGNKRNIWLDVRACSKDPRGGCLQQYPNPLTARLLYEKLKENTVRRDRTLIYVANLGPYCVLALTENTPFHQVDALRSAVRTHLAYRSLFRVLSSDRGYPMFQLHLHITFFSFRDHIESTKIRQWTDLSFLNPDLNKESTCGIFKSRFSLVLCGSDDQHWTGWAFSDRDLVENELVEHEFQCDTMLPHEDPIASDNVGGRVVDANTPIRDARAYFLVIFEIRIAAVSSEWEVLVRAVERGVEDFDRYLTSTTRRRAQKIWQKASNWEKDASALITQLAKVLAETVRALENFCSPHGDIAFFDNIGPSQREQDQTTWALESITHSFASLKSNYQRLVTLNDNCQQLARTLELLLTADSNEAVRHTILMTEWTILVFSPIALSITYFSMPELPFKPTPQVFFVACALVLLLVKLLFDLSGGNVHETWWWRSMIWLSNLSHSGSRTSSDGKGIGDGPVRHLWRRSPTSLEDTEMETIAV